MAFHKRGGSLRANHLFKSSCHYGHTEDAFCVGILNVSVFIADTLLISQELHSRHHDGTMELNWLTNVMKFVNRWMRMSSLIETRQASLTVTEQNEKYLLNMQTRDRGESPPAGMALPSDWFSSPSELRSAPGSGAANDECPLQLNQSLIFALHFYVCVWIINQPAVMA